MPPRYPFDLQIQSTISDGEYSPEAIMQKARALGMSGVVITDHDTIAHLDIAIALAREYDLETIEGCEMSTNVRAATVHILAYARSFDRTSMGTLTARAEAGYADRVQQILEAFERQGIAIVTFEELRARKPIGPIVKHDALTAITEKSGRAGAEIDSLFRKGGKCFVPYSEQMLTPDEVIDGIHAAGGVAVLSHPGDVSRGRENQKEIEFFVCEMIERGVDGIEVYSAHHDPSIISLLETIARKKDLLATGGSDFHGPHHPAPHEIGSGGLDADAWRRFIERLP